MPALLAVSILLYSTLTFVGISTGSFELRADGKFHEWTIFNQYPAGAAKIQVIDDVFLGVRTATANGSVAVVLQTHPNDTRLPAVESLRYQGTCAPVHTTSVFKCSLCDINVILLLLLLLPLSSLPPLLRLLFLCSPS